MASWYCPNCHITVPAKDRLRHQDRHRHPKGHWSKGRDRGNQRKFRDAVLKQAGHRCQFVQGGVRCAVLRPLFAHHTEPGNDDPATGVALCREHHRQLDRNAR